MGKENIKLYSAKLYVVKDWVDYFTTKKFVLSNKDIDSISKQPKDRRTGRYIYTRMTTKGKQQIMIGEENYTNDIIFEELGDYYCGLNSEFRYMPKFMMNDVALNPKSKCFKLLKMLEYYDNLSLIVSEEPNHRVRDIVTGYDFPKMLGDFNWSWESPLLKVFEANQRIYANIREELTFDILEKELEGLTKEEIEKRREALLYIIEHARKQWHPVPEPPSVSDRILEFIMEERKKYLEKKVEKEKNKSEEEKIKQYIKTLEQMRK